jgi:hypothetical protein
MFFFIATLNQFNGNSPQKIRKGQKTQRKKEEAPFVLFALFEFFVVNCRRLNNLYPLSLWQDNCYIKEVIADAQNRNSRRWSERRERSRLC